MATLEFTPTATRFISDILAGHGREHGYVSTRGDGKTITALWIPIAHAMEQSSRRPINRATGQPGRYRLPVPWIGMTDTFESHRRKTVRTMQHDPIVSSLWTVEDAGHVAIGRLPGGPPLVYMLLFGIEDQQAKDRAKLVTCGVWGEEVAPTGEDLESRGFDEASWDVALSSQLGSAGTGRVATYCVCDTCRDPRPAVLEDCDNEGYVTGDSIPKCQRCGTIARRILPAMLTTNYPEEDHWFWQRYKGGEEREAKPGTMLYEGIPGERILLAPREDQPKLWAMRAARASEVTDPIIRDRLFMGRPGSPKLGDPVTPNYQAARHRIPTVLVPSSGDLWFGWDAWHHPAVAVGWVSTLGQLRVPFARRMDNADVGNLIDDYLLPWMAAHSLLSESGKVDKDRWTVHHTGDPTAWTPDQGDITHSAGQVVLKKLPGRWHPSSNDPAKLFRAVRAALGNSISTGDPKVLLCGPATRELDRALSGGWHLKKDGKAQKTGWEGRHGHVGDALAHLCHVVFGATSTQDNRKWESQSAYRQPWDGQPVGVSASPALAGRQIDRERWMRQYQEG